MPEVSLHNSSKTELSWHFRSRRLEAHSEVRLKIRSRARHFEPFNPQWNNTA